MKLHRSRLTVLSLSLLWTTSWTALSLAAPPTAASPGRFEFAEINRSYTDLATDIAPIEVSGITVQLESPAHELVIHSNQLKLVPQADGSYLAELALRFSGRGELLADIRMGRIPSHLEDELVVPEQTQVLHLQVRFARGAQGYLVTALTMPKSMHVRIQSRIGGNLVAVCNQLGLLLGLNCSGLSRAFTEIDVPLPEAGETYLVEFSQVGEEGRRQLDAYLGFAESSVGSNGKTGDAADSRR